MAELTDILIDILSEAKDKIPKPKLHKDRKEGPIRPTVKEAIKNSIDNRWLLFIEYEGDEETVKGSRWVEPYVWGLHYKSRNNVLRAYQYKGQTLTPDKHPGWRMYRLDRISNTAPLTTATFNKPRPLYHADDEQMSKYIARVDFGKEPEDDKGTEGGAPPPVDINSDEIKQTAKIIGQNVEDGKVDFDELEKKPEFRESKMKRALQVLRKLLQKVGKGIVKGLQNLHLKEDIDNETD